MFVATDEPIGRYSRRDSQKCSANNVGRIVKTGADAADCNQESEHKEKRTKLFVSVEKDAGGNGKSNVCVSGRERNAVDAKTLDDRRHHLAAMTDEWTRAPPKKRNN